MFIQTFVSFFQFLLPIVIFIVAFTADRLRSSPSATSRRNEEMLRAIAITLVIVFVLMADTAVRAYMEQHPRDMLLRILSAIVVLRLLGDLLFFSAKSSGASSPVYAFFHRNYLTIQALLLALLFVGYLFIRTSLMTF
jgi:uncharacterized membrane protein